MPCFDNVKPFGASKLWVRGEAVVEECFDSMALGISVFRDETNETAYLHDYLFLLFAGFLRADVGK